jgi:hypothetical protein
MLPILEMCVCTPISRPAMLYGTECWAVKNQHENQVSVAEMMLCWMSGKTRRDRIRNDTISERVGGSAYSRKDGRK